MKLSRLSRENVVEFKMRKVYPKGACRNAGAFFAFSTVHFA